MVYYFTSNVVSPPATIYVGKDKYESTRQSHFCLRLKEQKLTRPTSR